MIQLVALLLFGILVLVVGLYALRRPPPATTENDASADDVHQENPPKFAAFEAQRQNTIDCRDNRDT